MQHPNAITTLAISISLALSGGSAVATTPQQTENSSHFAPHDMTQRSFSNVDLLILISGNAQASENIPKDMSDEEYAKKLEAALRAFPTTGDADLLRNRVQDRLILSSNDLCEDYKSNLKRKHSRFNFFTGIGASVFGLAGSLAPHAATAKIFSALAGATTGVRAEYNHDYYANVTVHLITAAINNVRKDLLTDIDAQRGKKIGEYTLERALAEVVQYHGACSLIGGLEKAAKDVTTVDLLTGPKASTNELLELAKLKAALKALSPPAPAAAPAATP